MPRLPRMVQTDSGQKAVYHVISRTALDGLPFKDFEKEELVSIIRHFSSIYAVEVLGYAIMGNHFHLLVEMHPASSLTDDDVKRRFSLLQRKETPFPETLMEKYRERFSSLSQYMKDIKQTFSHRFNKRHKRRGTLWGERFKSVMVEKGNTVINCLAYIDLNAVRAGIVKRPEEYRWCSIGYHSQAGNRWAFLSTNFGLEEFGVEEKERLKQYRKYLYHVGAMDKHGKARISREDLERAESDDFELNRVKRFRLRTRYFTDSGAIGSRAFIEGMFHKYKDRFEWKRSRVPKPVSGVDGMYSMKRLGEIRS